MRTLRPARDAGLVNPGPSPQPPGASRNQKSFVSRIAPSVARSFEKLGRATVLARTEAPAPATNWRRLQVRRDCISVSGGWCFAVGMTRGRGRRESSSVSRRIMVGTWLGVGLRRVVGGSEPESQSVGGQRRFDALPFSIFSGKCFGRLSAEVVARLWVASFPLVAGTLPLGKWWEVKEVCGRCGPCDALRSKHWFGGIHFFNTGWPLDWRCGTT